jgi:thiol-disulfide isomerase/thioredoxin
MKSVAALAVVMAPAFCAVKAGDPAPDIVLKALLPNQPVAAARLDALKGKAIVLEFWATWCGPCVGAIPHLNELVDKVQGRAIQFLSVTGEEAPVVEKFLAARPIHGWVGLDDADRTYKPYGFEGIPQTVLIDAAGKVAGIASPEILTAAHVEDLLAGRLPKLPPPPERPDFSTPRSGSDTVPRPMLDIVVRPSTAKEGAMKAGKGILQFRWFTLRDLLSYAYHVPPERILGEAADDGMRYDASLAAPGVPGDDFGEPPAPTAVRCLPRDRQEGIAPDRRLGPHHAARQAGPARRSGQPGRDVTDRKRGTQSDRHADGGLRRSSAGSGFETGGGRNPPARQV